MKKTFSALQVLNNLNNIKRTGPNLCAGIPTDQLESIAEHSYKVAYLCLIFSRYIENLNIENLLTYALIDDWGEAILGDVPSQSPSFKSYFDGDPRKYFKKAEKKARDEILTDANVVAPEFNTEELKLFKFCDSLAIVLELVNLKQNGLKHKWINKMFDVQIRHLSKFEYDFTEEVIKELKRMFKEGMDNKYLTKATSENN